MSSGTFKWKSVGCIWSVFVCVQTEQTYRCFNNHSITQTCSFITEVLNASARFSPPPQCSSSACWLSSARRLREQEWWTPPSPSPLYATQSRSVCGTCPGWTAVATVPGGQIGHSQRQRLDILTHLKMTSVNEWPLGLSVHLPSKSTSPMRRIFPVLGSWMRFMPTSMTAAPSLTILAVMSPGTPSHRHRRDTLESQTCPGHASARSQLISEECAF